MGRRHRLSSTPRLPHAEFITEADTCRKYVVPLLVAAGWDNDPHSIAEQRTFTDGRIIVHGGHAKRRPGKRPDYLLRYGMVAKEFDGAFVSQEYPTFECSPRHVRAEFLAAYFKPAHVWKDVATGSKSLGDRRQRVQPAQVLAHELWLPPIAWQYHLAEVQAEVDALKRLQAETATEIDALLPAILDRAFKGQM